MAALDLFVSRASGFTLRWRILFRAAKENAHGHNVGGRGLAHERTQYIYDHGLRTGLATAQFPCGIPRIPEVSRVIT